MALNRCWEKRISDNLAAESKDAALKEFEGQFPWSVLQKVYVAGVVSRELKIKEILDELKAIKRENVNLSTRIDGIILEYGELENLEALVK